MTEVDGPETANSMNRRKAVKTFVGLGLASALTDCTPASQGSAGEMPGLPPTQGPQLEPEPEVAPSPDEHEHPADGDVRSLLMREMLMVLIVLLMRHDLIRSYSSVWTR